MIKSILLRLPFLFLLFGNSAWAALSPIGLSIFPPLQFPTADVAVTGIRANILWGKHRAVYGVDIGLLGNMTTQEFTGLLQVGGLFSRNGGESHILGLQVAGLANINVNKSSVIGAAVSVGMNSNLAESRVIGLQVAGLANYAPHTKVIGAQIGLYNKARSVYGIQIGLINIAEALHGLQIGLVNIHRLGIFPICPALNFGF